jgi:hypothetical protein
MEVGIGRIGAPSCRCSKADHGYAERQNPALVEQWRSKTAPRFALTHKRSSTLAKAPSNYQAPIPVGSGNLSKECL